MAVEEIYDHKELAVRVADGDEHAFGKLYQLYADQIYSVALIYTKDISQAEDLVQAVFLKVWEVRGQLKTIEKFDSWLFILARNQMLAQLRRNAVHQTYIEQLKEKMNSPIESPELEFLRKEQRGLIHEAVQSLSPQQRTAFLLQREEGLSYAEIAARMGIAVNTVRVHLYKALETLRIYMKQHGSAGIIVLFLLIRE